MNEKIRKVVSHFFSEETIKSIVQVKSGLINQTYKVHIGDAYYVLQRINSNVFAHPEIIHNNLDLLKKYISGKEVDMPLILPLSDQEGKSMYFDGEEFYRFFPWISDSLTIEVVKTPHQAYEAAKQFARFTAVFNDFDLTQLQPVILDFHNLQWRFTQFQAALEAGNHSRIKQSKDLIQAMLHQKPLVDQYNQITVSPFFRTRVMHHDAKISNVLLDNKDCGICVIDLDTVMPGYIISDWGDMVRTYVCPVSEEESDFSKIYVRKDYFDAIQEAYLSELGSLMSELEKNSLHLSGQILVYMQALRFMTDFLLNDQYYGAAYEGHNFIRAGNQMHLLQALQSFDDSTSRK
ncbi:MAG: aminoglycoside phosphotransferase family protein [Saprospiraceae bacterium]|jgi:Ser/Thr protein kinase RdoA (MazF antagonist)|nr:aminoglycoside phosphotransferase family protein [Saprospiraceae bacterium]HMT77126.1 aminoglycoside phosphotransferase family protein [Saprospiraceae bacterium]